MAEIDWGWVRTQLESLGVSGKITKGVRALLEAYEDGDISQEDIDTVLRLVGTLAKGYALVKDEDPEDNRKWVRGEAGDFVVGDNVRVRADAFTGQVGRIHNGREGRVVAIRVGDIIVRSTDGKEPVLEDVHYLPHQLDRLV